MSADDSNNNNPNWPNACLNRLILILILLPTAVQIKAANHAVKLIFLKTFLVFFVDKDAAMRDERAC